LLVINGRRAMVVPLAVPYRPSEKGDTPVLFEVADARGEL